MSSLLAVLILAAMTTGFGILLLVISGNLGPKRKPTPAKMMPYESGIPGQESKDSKISVKFYLTAILFIIFDIEIIFMYPWAVTFMDFVKQGQGIYILGAMGVFILLFVVGLVWEVKSKALDWNR
ncbi:MAG TPA: NADH-quinone oxidoreductase subunit A [Bdellovibrionales bacterium]|nr:NADH-quinone oxidoreductase subunit A [Bdellovibrionales bacterium]